MADQELYTVEISKWENGKLTPVRVPCTIVRENDTSYRVRVTFPDGEVRVIRKNKSKIFTNKPASEPKPEKESKPKRTTKKDSVSDVAPKTTSRRTKKVA